MNAITRTDVQQLSAPQKAELIYSQARSELSNRLWRAALGGDDADASAHKTGPDSESMALDSLLALFEPAKTAPATPPQPSATAAALGGDAPPQEEQDTATDSDHTPVEAAGLGPNARYQAALSSAAARTDIPAPALAAIVNAEAAKGSDGSWLTYSRNPRSSAAGLGQFLSGTWEGMAEAKGTWLNDTAKAKGWLDGAGRVVSGARSSLLALRYDAEASINTVADYARRNLDGLSRAGVPVGKDASTIAQSAYLGHHLGLGDAIKFAKGGLDPARARTLLCAQIGSAKASQDIAAAGDATAAHRAWFLDYVDRHVNTHRFGV
jgi:hypothetical protein